MKKINLKNKILLTILFVGLAIICLHNKVFAAQYEELTYLIDPDTKEITITDCAEGATEIVVPSEINGYKVTAIRHYTFSNCKDLESVTIPSCVKSLDYGLFSGCTNLKNVTLPPSINKIGSYFFQNCTSLETINIPSKVKTIEYEAFYGCSSLKDIKFPSSVTTIENNAFDSCISLKSINLPINLTALKSETFRNCTSLEQIEIPMTLSTFFSTTFNDCINLRKIILPKDINIIEYYYSGDRPFYNLPDDITFFVVKDSSAHMYAINNDLNFQLYTTPLSKCSISGISNKTYTGNNQNQSLKLKYGGYTLKNGTDYKVTYQNNINVGTASLTIKGQGAFSGSITKTFKISPQNISNCKLSNMAQQTYTGQEKKPDVTLKNGNVVLRKNIDYTLGYKNNKNTGKATVIITAKGNYTGTLKTSFIITPSKVQKFKIKTTTTNSFTLTWNKNPGNVSGYVIYGYNPNGEDQYYYDAKNKNTFNFKSLASGTKYKFVVWAYKIVDGEAYFSDNSITISGTTITKAPKISSLKSLSNQKVKIKWSKSYGASGYEIYMATKKKGKFTKIKHIKKGNITSYKKANLRAKKTYYFKLRAYKIVNGKKVYSSYSNTKKVKVKE